MSIFKINRSITHYPLPILLLLTITLSHYRTIAQALELDFIPMANLSLLGGQYYFEKEAASFGGNIYLDLIPVMKFTDELSLIPTYSGAYRGTKNVTELVGGGTLYQQAQDHLLALRLTNQMSESFKMKVNTSYKLELLQETKDESWGNGLFDYYKIAAGLEGEKKFFPETLGVDFLTGGYTFYMVKFNNYSSLAEKTTSYGTELTGKVGQNILDFNAHEIYIYSNFVLNPNIRLKGNYSFTYKGFSDQKVIQDGPSYTDDKRNDLIHWLNLTVSHFHGKRKGLKFVGLMGIELISSSSNQNHYDAKKTKFIPKYYNYLELAIKPGVNILFGKKGQGIDFSYKYAYRNYSERLVQDSAGDYSLTNEKINTKTSTISLGTTYPLHKKLNLRLQVNYLVSSSNMEYEKVYRYNYNTMNYFLGAGWEL